MGAHGHGESGHGGHSESSGGGEGVFSAFKSVGAATAQVTGFVGTMFTALFGSEGGGGHGHH